MYRPDRLDRWRGRGSAGMSDTLEAVRCKAAIGIVLKSAKQDKRSVTLE